MLTELGLLVVAVAAARRATATREARVAIASYTSATILAMCRESVTVRGVTPRPPTVAGVVATSGRGHERTYANLATSVATCQALAMKNFLENLILPGLFAF